MAGRTETDRTIWFSMWFLVAIATFGLAFFPMFYQLVERRNKHFLRQQELENRVKTYFRKEGKELQPTASSLPERNAKLWAVSIILILPVFVIAYFLSKDLLLHEKNQQAFLTRLTPDRGYVRQNIEIEKYALVTVATLGAGVIYWLYKIINMYNSHFKEERRIEAEMIRLMEGKSYVEPV